MLQDWLRQQLGCSLSSASSRQQPHRSFQLRQATFSTDHILTRCSVVGRKTSIQVVSYLSNLTVSVCVCCLLQTAVRARFPPSDERSLPSDSFVHTFNCVKLLASHTRISQCFCRPTFLIVCHRSPGTECIVGWDGWEAPSTRLGSGSRARHLTLLSIGSLDLVSLPLLLVFHSNLLTSDRRRDEHHYLGCHIQRRHLHHPLLGFRTRGHCHRSVSSCQLKDAAGHSI